MSALKLQESSSKVHLLHLDEKAQGLQEKQQYESQLRALPDDQSQRNEHTQLQHEVGLLKARIQALDAAVKKRQVCATEKQSMGFVTFSGCSKWMTSS